MAKTQKSTASDQDAIALRAWLAVVRAYNQCDTVLASKLGAIGYTTAQYEVVSRLHRDPGQTQQELAQRCFVAKSGISMLIKRMEEGGWVLRSADEQDARIKRLTLTDEGQRQSERMLIVQQEALSVMAEPLTSAELLQLTEMMGRVNNSLLLIK